MADMGFEPIPRLLLILCMLGRPLSPSVWKPSQLGPASLLESRRALAEFQVSELGVVDFLGRIKNVSRGPFIDQRTFANLLEGTSFWWFSRTIHPLSSLPPFFLGGGPLKEEEPPTHCCPAGREFVTGRLRAAPIRSLRRLGGEAGRQMPAVGDACRASFLGIFVLVARHPVL